MPELIPFEVFLKARIEKDPEAMKTIMELVEELKSKEKPAEYPQVMRCSPPPFFTLSD